MTVLVTGATGLLGSHLTDLLLGHSRAVRVLVRPGDKVRWSADSTIEICRGDLSDRSSLLEAVRGVDCVLHCAARTGPWGPEPEYESANVRGLRTLVDAGLAAGARRFVHVSSATVHGTDVGGTVDETAPLRVEPNPYTRSKVTGERLLGHMIREQGVPVTIIRPGWIYGSRDVASFARFARMIDRGKMVIIGSGDNHLSLIHVRDAAQGIVLASGSAEAAGRAYILVNDEPVTQYDYLTAIATELHVSPPKHHVPYHLALMLGTGAEAVGHLLRWQNPPPVTRFGIRLLAGENRFVIGRARQELGFSPQINLIEGVRESVAWYRTVCAASRGQEQ